RGSGWPSASSSARLMRRRTRTADSPVRSPTSASKDTRRRSRRTGRGSRTNAVLEGCSGAGLGDRVRPVFHLRERSGTAEPETPPSGVLFSRRREAGDEAEEAQTAEGGGRERGRLGPDWRSSVLTGMQPPGGEHLRDVGER